MERTCIIAAGSVPGLEAYFGEGLTTWTPPAADRTLAAYLHEGERNYIIQAPLLNDGHIPHTPKVSL
jgi:hypothetical protein